MEFSRFEHSVVGFLYMVFCVTGVMSNSLLVMTFLREKALLRSSKTWLHIGLAIANILVVAPAPFPASSSFSGKWLYGDTGCQLYAFEGMLAGIAAIGYVIGLCVERYMVATRKEAMEENSNGFYWATTFLIWVNAFFWAIMPILGWSKYVHETPGASCAINWRDADEGYPSYMIMLCLFSFGVPLLMAITCLMSASGHSSGQQASTSSGQSSQVDAVPYFKEDQLRNMCIAFLIFVVLGWGPFGFICIWALFNAPVQVSMMAASIPPLACKSMVLMYPFTYLLMNERFRYSYFSLNPFSSASAVTSKKD